MHRRFANCLLLLLGHFAAPFASADTYGSGWYGELQVTAGREDNVARSYKSVDVLGATVASVGLGTGYSQNIRENLRYVISGYVTYNHHDTFTDLSNIVTSLGASFTWQPTPGYDTAWYQGTFEVSRLDYHNSDAREGYLFIGSASINHRLGMRANGHIGYRYVDLVFLGKDDTGSRRDAAFDIARHELFLGADYQLANRLYLLADYRFQHGGFTSSVSGTTARIAYDAETVDPVFQTCNTLRCTPSYAFRSVANVHSVELGLALSLAGINYDLTGQYIDAHSKGGANYTDWLVKFGMVWTF